MNYNLKLKGYVGGWDFDTDYTDYILEKYAGQHVDVVIDSLGGRLDTALSISAAFKAHGDVTVHYVGMNASAATIASLGAKRVTIDRNAWFMVHKSSFKIAEWRDMNSDQIEEFIAKLEKSRQQLAKFDAGIAQAYAKRCKKTPEELYELMKEEKFISAQEALEWGFVDEVTEHNDDAEPVIDRVTEAYCYEHGIKLPQSVKRNYTPEPDREDFISRIVASVKSAFSSHSNTQDNMDPNQTTTTNEVEEQTAAPENSEQQEATQPENSADDRDARIAELTAENQALKAQLDKKPADEHHQVTDDAPSKAAGFRNNFSKSASDLYNVLP